MAVLGEGWVALLGVALLGYLIGSIPFGVIVTRIGGAGDLREIGSGNIGATNVLRTGRKGLAALTLILDAAKGAAAVAMAQAIDPDLAALAAAGAFLGHLYPVWLGFHGGKGVATYLGLALALHWPCGLAFAIVWLGATFASRISSVGGMAASIAPPVLSAIMDRFDLAILFLCFTALLLLKHRANLSRLLDGTEPRIGAGGA